MVPHHHRARILERWERHGCRVISNMGDPVVGTKTLQAPSPLCLPMVQTWTSSFTWHCHCRGRHGPFVVYSGTARHCMATNDVWAWRRCASDHRRYAAMDSWQGKQWSQAGKTCHYSLPAPTTHDLWCLQWSSTHQGDPQLLWCSVHSPISWISRWRPLQMSPLRQSLWFCPGPARACLELASKMFGWETLCLQWHVSGMWSLLLDGSTSPATSEVNAWWPARMLGLPNGVLWSATSTGSSYKARWSPRIPSPPAECYLWAPWKTTGTYMATLASATTGPMWLAMGGIRISYSSGSGHDWRLWCASLSSYAAMAPRWTSWCGRAGKCMAWDLCKLAGRKGCNASLSALGALQDVRDYLHVDWSGWYRGGRQPVSSYGGAHPNLEPVVWARCHSQSTPSSSRASPGGAFTTQESSFSHWTWAYSGSSSRAERAATTRGGHVVPQSHSPARSAVTAWWSGAMLLGGDAHVRRATQGQGLLLLGTSAPTTVLRWCRLRSADVVSGHGSGSHQWEHGQWPSVWSHGASGIKWTTSSGSWHEWAAMRNVVSGTTPSPWRNGYVEGTATFAHPRTAMGAYSIARWRRSSRCGREVAWCSTRYWLKWT